MAAKIINGKKIAEKIRSSVSKELEKYDNAPNITTIKIGSNPESDLYLRLRDKACEKVGINTKNLELDENISQKKILSYIKNLNQDKKVHGILIQLPLPNHISQKKLYEKLDPCKDVEGLTPENIGRTLIGEEDLIPITPLAVISILDYEKIDYKGKDVVMINHSNIVGKPLSMLLLNRNCSVSICHVFTKDLKNYTSNADVLISAAGVPSLIKKEHVKKGCFIVDVGIIETEDGIVGDVDFEDVKEVAGKITPVPGGVGPVTVACSLKNMVKTFRKCVED